MNILLLQKPFWLSKPASQSLQRANEDESSSAYEEMKTKQILLSYYNTRIVVVLEKSLDTIEVKANLNSDSYWK